MLAATSPANRGLLFRSSCRQAPCRPRQTKTHNNHVSLEGGAEGRVTGSWFIIAGYTGAAFRGDRGAERLTIVRSGSRSLGARILDRLAGRDRYRVLWHDEDRGHCVITRGRRQVWILSRASSMQTRDLFQRVADLRQHGYDTRPLHYAHVA